MQALVESMTAEHTKLLALFTKIRDTGLGTPVSNALLPSVRLALGACLAREETELFPALMCAGVPHNLQSRIRHSIEGLAALKTQAKAFFQRWECGGEGLEYARDFGRLVGALQFRVRMDETYLYSALEGSVRQQRAV